MEELDAALNELGMLSSVTKYKLDYLQAMEAAAEVTKARARADSMPSTVLDTGKGDPDQVSITVNSNFVTNIAISSAKLPPDLSPFMKRKLEAEAREKRTADTGPRGSRHVCSRHATCHSSHICAFVSPRRTRSALTRTSPYTLASLAPPVAGVLTSFRHKIGGRLRGPVRFHDAGQSSGEDTSQKSQGSSLYPLDDDLTSKLSSIQLSPEARRPEDTVTSDLSRLVITRPGSGTS